VVDEADCGEILDAAPQLASPATRAPEGDGWIHEIKYDGYRLLCRVRAGRARLISRNGKDWTERFPSVIEAVESLSIGDAVLDGEVAVVGADGRTRFQELQNALGGGLREGALRYFLFDLLCHEGVVYVREPLITRKAALSELLSGSENPVLHYSDHVEGNGPAFHGQACRFGLEGIISKRRNSPYRPGRSKDWLKVKCLSVDEFVVGGYTEAAGSRVGFGALLLGGHDVDGRLRFAGRVGTGFSDSQLRELALKLESLACRQSPFQDGPDGRAARGMHWVRPVMVVQVAYAQFTDDGVIRHATFRGEREDRPAAEVVHPLFSGDAAPARSAPDSDSRDTRTSSDDTGDRTMDGDRPAPVRRSGGRKAAARRSSGGPGIEGITITNPDKVMYPDAGITKGELAEYYARVAGWMLPWVADRPLTLVRCPNGIADCFYQKHIEGSVPPGIFSVPVREDDEEAEYAAVDSPAGLVGLAQLGVLEIHTWGSHRDDLERPDRFTLDFDPDPQLPWIRTVEAVLETRGFLGELGLRSFLKTTGGKGLHVVVPIQPDLGWASIKEFSRRVAAWIEADNPGKFTLSMSKERRRGRILIDYLRNGRGATAIEAYSTRARAGAPVAVPIRWEELADGVRSDTFDLRGTLDRLDSLADDPWADYAEVARQRITAAMRETVERMA